jgi:hypothetical protein
MNPGLYGYVEKHKYFPIYMYFGKTALSENEKLSS